MRRKWCLITLTFIIVLTGLPSISLAKTVVINPGHANGIDSGAECELTTEAELNERVAIRLMSELDNRGYTVYLTHCSDPAYAERVLTSVDTANTLSNLGPIINAVNPDFTISIHHNYGKPDSSGYQIYYSSCKVYDTIGTYFDQSMWYGAGGNRDVSPCMEALRSKQFSTILNSYLKQGKLPFNGIFDRNDYIPVNTNSPAVLYEGGFLSNQKEAQYLVSEEFTSSSSKMIADAIDEFFKTPEPIFDINILSGNIFAAQEHQFIRIPNRTN